VSWSVELLGEAERRLLARLSGKAGPRAVRLVNVHDRRTGHRACHRGRARRGREPDGGAPGPLHRFTQAWDQGQALTLDDAVAYATRRSGGRKRPATGWASLTPAEREVVRLVGEGLRNDAIAGRLFIAPGTVKVHLTHIFAKLGITTRAELAAQAASHDLTAS